MKCTFFGKYLYFSCVFLASSIKMSYIWSVQFINFKSCARHGFRDFLMLRLILTFLFASFAFFLKAQSVFFGFAKPVLTKDLNIKESFPFSFDPYAGAELEFWKVSEDTPQGNIDRVSIHVIKKEIFNKKINNEEIKYNYDANIRYTLDSLCIVHDVVVSDTYDVLSEDEYYYWIGSNEIWFTNIIADDPISKDYLNKENNNKIKILTKRLKNVDSIGISEQLFNWIKTNFPALKITEKKEIHPWGDF